MVLVMKLEFYVVLNKILLICSLTVRGNHQVLLLLARYWLVCPVFINVLCIIYG